MGCVVCRHPEAKAINLILLQREGRRTGAIQELANRLKIRRETLCGLEKVFNGQAGADAGGADGAGELIKFQGASVGIVGGATAVADVD